MDLSEYLDLFLSESREHLENVDQALVRLEQDPGDQAALDAFLRGVHTLKGTSASMGYQGMAEVAHAMEDLFRRLQDRPGLDREALEVLFEAVDLLRGFLDRVEAGQEGIGEDLAPFLERLRGTIPGEVGTRPSSVFPGAAPGPLPPDAVCVHFTLGKDLPAKGARAYVLIRRLGQMGEVVGLVPPVEALKAPGFDGSVWVWLVPVKPLADLEALAQQHPELVVWEILPPISEGEESLVGRREERPKALAGATRRPEIGQKTVRVGLTQVEKLAGLMVEAIVNRARLEERVRQSEDESLKLLIGEQGRILERIRETVLDLRMVPVGTLLNRYPRMVRDLLRAAGKEAQLVLEGTDVEVDRAILERLDEPLVHLVRNAVAHGLEDPAERAQAGKPREGMVAIRVERRQDGVLIEVSDDGRGLDRSTILRRAVEQGILSQESASRLTDEEAWTLICHRSFSTAPGVTPVAGRGVGMHVVREAVEELRGELEIELQPGRGATFRLHLPLSLAILPALVVQAGAQLFAIPMSQVAGVVNLEHDIGGVRGPVYPLLALLGGGGSQAAQAGAAGRAVLVGRMGREAALAVDRLQGVQEIVVRPLGGLFGGTPGLEGATILADGQVALVLNAGALLSERGYGPERGAAVCSGGKPSD